MSPYRLAPSPTGVLTLQDQDSGEFLHRYYGPIQEARQVYAEPSHVQDATGTMVICDLGLGAGFNVLETLKLGSQNPKLRHLEIVSFDLHTQGFELLLANLSQFPELVSLGPVMAQVLSAWQRGEAATFALRSVTPEATSPATVSWRISLGDAFERLPLEPAALRFDALFYDMFSWQSEPQLWTSAAFKTCVDRLSHEGVLMTYSTATPVRAILLALGCWVGDGAPVTTKMKSTLASKNPQRIPHHLDEAWLQKFRRSGRPFFEVEDPEMCPIIRQRVEEHPQFQVGFPTA